MEKTDFQINAVLDRNLKSLFVELELEEALIAGKLQCPECGKVLTFENIGALKVYDDSIIIICDDYTCMVNSEV